MRSVLNGAVALSVALGAGAAYAENPNVPSSSPYAAMGYGPSAPAYANPAYPPPVFGGQRMVGRSVYFEPTFGPPDNEAQGPRGPAGSILPNAGTIGGGPSY